MTAAPVAVEPSAGGAASSEADPRGARAGRRDHRVRLTLLTFIAGTAVLQVPLVFWRNVNWDEFRFLSDVHALQRGTLTSSVQTFHTRVFGWLTAVPGTEVDQVVAARCVYFILLAVSCIAVFQVARRFASTRGALFAVLCMVSFSEIIAHGTSFRFDGLALPLVLVSLALLLRASESNAATVAAAALFATGLMVTAKTVFYLPLLGVAVVLAHPGSVRRRLSLFSIATTVVLAVLYTLHSRGVTAGAPAEDVGMLEMAGRKVFELNGLFPQKRYLARAVLMNAGIWVFLVGGGISAVRRVVARRRTSESLLLLSLLVPLASVAVYRNSFPYYYVFVMPPAFVLCAVCFDDLWRRARGGARIPFFVQAAIFTVVTGFLVTYGQYARDETSRQRQLLATIHAMFPEPTGYIDRSSMVASFPKHGFFMSTWGFENYLAAGVPVFPSVLREAQPKFLVANHPALQLSGAGADPPRHRLMARDAAILRENYVHHWGPVFVAGKRLELSAGRVASVEILISGVYVLTADAAARVDGVWYTPGARVPLSQGTHTVVSHTDQTITFRHEVGGPAPGEIGSEPLFRGL